MEWITQNGNQVGVAVLLMIAVLAFYKGWVVPGPTYKKTEQERDDAVAELKAQNATISELVAYIKRPPEVRP